MFTKYFTITLLGLLTTQFFSGCTIVRSKITLVNTDYSNTGKPSPKALTICLQRFNDSADSSTMGHVQNMYGMKIGTIQAKNSVTDWVMQGITGRLQSEGYTVETVCNQNSQEITLDGAVIRVYTTAYQEYQGEVIISVEASHNGRVLFSKQFTGYKKQGDFWSPSKIAYAKILGKALESFLDQLVATLDASIMTPEQLPLPLTEATDIQLKQYSAVPESALVDINHCNVKQSGFSIISGSRSRTSIQEGLVDVSPSILPIYRDHCELHPGKQGQVCVQMSITPKGSVEYAHILQSTLDAPTVEKALLDILRKTSFGKSRKSSENTIVVYSKKFAASSVKSSRVGIGILTMLIMLIPSIVLVSLAQPN